MFNNRKVIVTLAAVVALGVGSTVYLANAGSGVDAQSGINGVMGADINTPTNAVGANSVNTSVEVETETEMETERDMDSEAEADTESETKSETKFQADLDTEAQADTDAELDADVQTNGNLEIETES